MYHFYTVLLRNFDTISLIIPIIAYILDALRFIISIVGLFYTLFDTKTTMTLRRSQSWRHRKTYCCLSFISWRLLFCALHKTTNVQTSCYRTFKELWFRSNGSLRCHHLTNKVRRTFLIRFPSRVSTPIYFPIVFKQTITNKRMDN